LLRGTQSPDLEAAIKNLIRLSLTSFSEEKPRQIVLQYSASVRRLAKIILAIVPAANTVGTYNHQQIRHIVDELNDLQMLTSPAREPDLVGQDAAPIDQSVRIQAPRRSRRI
ncbi:hypothetical protein, partial [Xanthomonas vasicola]